MGHKATRFFIDAATAQHIKKGDVLDPKIFDKDAIETLVGKGLAVDERKYEDKGTVEFDRDQAQREADMKAEAEATEKAKAEAAAAKAKK